MFYHKVAKSNHKARFILTSFDFIISEYLNDKLKVLLTKVYLFISTVKFTFTTHN